MMIIAHRANINGPNPETENTPQQILLAIEKGFDVEVDVWYKDGEWYLGHDESSHKVDWSFISSNAGKLWVHAKNLDAVEILSKNQNNIFNVNWFWHQEDYVTLTSKGYVWCFPGYETDGGIMVDHGQQTDKNMFGICTDNPLKHRSHWRWTQ